MKKTKISNRILAALLCALLLLPAVACGTEGTTAETTAAPNTTTAPAETTAAPETEPGAVEGENYFMPDSLDPTLDFGGETFTTLYWEDREWGGITDLEFFVEEKNGENVNDALYKRNETVEKRLNIDFEWIGTNGSGFNGGIQNYLSVVRKSNDSGDLAYDMLGGYALSLGVCAQNGLLLDLLEEVDYIDFEKPWWPQKLTEQAIIKDKLYFASGDISQSLIYMMYVCYFNKTLLENYQLESPYELVLNNEWTVDKVFEMSTGVYDDLNGNGVKDVGDQYGFWCNLLHGDAFLWGSGVNVIVNNGEDGISLNPQYASERTQDILTKACSFFFDTNDGYMYHKFAFELVQEFVEGHALFYYDRLSTATRPDIRDNENLTYGIVPIPVYDDMQDTFSTYLGDQLVLYAIPLKQDDTDLSGAVMECMASEGYRTVTPELFGVAMKVKYSKDEITSQMLDIARDCITFDLGRIFHTSLDGLPTVTWQNAIAGNTPNWLSIVKRLTNVMQKRIDNLNKAFD